MMFKKNPLARKIFRFISNTCLKIYDKFIPTSIDVSKKNQKLRRRVLRSLPVIGYLMALTSVADCLYAIVPLRLQNPAWEIAALNSITTHSWGILIGFGFVLTTFMDETVNQIKPIEIYVINLFRSVILLMGIFFILAIPLTIVDTLRLNTINQQTIMEQVNLKKEFAKQVEANINSIADPRQLFEIAQNLNISLTPSDPSSTENLKKQIQQKLPKVGENLDKLSTIEIDSKAKYQWKDAIRLLFQLCIFIIANFFVWIKTRKIKDVLG